MSMNDQVGADIATAMKARDASRLSALRMLKAAVMNKGVEKGRDLDDAEVLQVIASLVKQRRDSIEQFSKAGRTDLVEKETAELNILQAYLPAGGDARRDQRRSRGSHRRNRSLLAEGHGQGDEGGHAETRRQERRRESRQRSRPAHAWRLSEPPPRLSLARSAASAGAATMTSRILGVVREQVLASFFGAGAAMDAYNVAFRIPNLLRDLFAEGAMSAAFVPTFTTSLTTSGKESAWRLGNHVVNALIVVTGALVVLGIVFMEPLILSFAAEKYTSDPKQLALTVQMARIMLPALTLIALAAAFMGMLNSLHHYFIPALSPATFNVLTIICAFVLVPLMPALGLEPIVAIAIGTLLGGVAQLALQWPTLHREGFRYRLEIDWQDPGLRRMLHADGARHGGPCGDAGQRVRQHIARDRHRDRCGLVAAVRVPVDVSADRVVRRVDRDGVLADGVASDGRPRQRGGERHDRQRRVADADAERAGERRTGRAGSPDRARDLRARPSSPQRIPRRPPPHCSSTRSACSGTQWFASCRRSSTPSGATARQ